MVKWRLGVASAVAGALGLSGLALVMGTPVGAAAGDVPATPRAIVGEHTVVDSASKSVLANAQTKKKGRRTFTGPDYVERGQKFTLTGSVPWTKKVKGKRKVVLQMKAGGTWKRVAAKKVGAKKRVTFIAKRKKTGTVAYRLVAPTVKQKRKVVAKKYRSPSLKVVVIVKPKTPPPPAPVPTSDPARFPAPVAPGPYDEHDHAVDPWNPFSPKPAGRASDWASIVMGGQARWNSCEVITWDYDPTGSYAGSLRDLKRSFNRVSEASGLRFRYIGVNPADAVMEPGAAIKVQWRSLEEGVLGVANMQFYPHPTGYEIFEATIDFTLDYAFAPGMGDGGAAYPSPAGVVMQHELMHAIGLGHAARNTQIMYPYITPTSYRMGAGDLTGLRAVGSEQGCL